MDSKKTANEVAPAEGGDGDGGGEKKDERYSVDFWRRWIRAAKKASQIHFDEAREAWEEYEEHTDRPYPIYWSSVKVLEPAYYSRTPKITTNREFGINDDVALTMGMMSERMGRHLIGECGFDSIMQKAILDFIHADKATTQVIYEADFEDSEVRVPLAPSEDEKDYVDEKGIPYKEEVFQDEQGFFGNRVEKVPVNQKVYIAECSYDEVLHTPEAKNEAEITEKAYYFVKERSAAEKRFGDKVSKIQWRTKRSVKQSSDREESSRDLTDVPGEYIEGWECWDLINKRTYWVSDQYQEGFLDEQDDPYGLKDFYPSPKFIISNRPSKSLYPCPSYQHLKECIETLHDSAARIQKLSQGVKRRALVDGADDDLIAALNSTEEGDYIAMTNLNKIIERGGLENSVLWVPLQELSKAIVEHTQLQEKFKNDFYEWFGVPDILRGATDPLETASAQEIKQNSAHNRFKFQKKQVAQLARDSIELMVDLAFKVYSIDLIKQIVGYDFMSQEHQQRFPAALQGLQNPKLRVVRLDIDTDTMSFVDDEQRAAKMQQAVTVLTNGLEKIYKMLELSPDYAAVGLQALLLSLETISPGKEFEDSVKKTINALIEKAMAPKKETPPPPDYEMLQIQLEQQRLQLDTQTKIRDLDRKDFQVQLKAQDQTAKGQISQLEAALKASSEEFSQQLEQFMAELEAQRVAIEQYKAEMQAKESAMEEVRLAAEMDEQVANGGESSKESAGKKEGGPAVVNVIGVPATSTLPAPSVLDVL